MESKQYNNKDKGLEKYADTKYSKKVIRFINDEGKLLFEVLDDTFLRMISGDGGVSCVLCNYVSDKEVKIDGKCIEIKEFVRKMQHIGIYMEPLN